MITQTFLIVPYQLVSCLLYFISLKAAEQHQLDVNIALKRQPPKRKTAAPPPPNPFTGKVEQSPPKNPFDEDEEDESFLLQADEVSAPYTLLL